MSVWTSEDARRATDGKVIGAWKSEGISIDTRTIKAGELFVPLKDVRDGHDFIPMAIEKGAIIMTERPIEGIPGLRVKDTLQALRDLGQAACVRSGAKRIAVTGSVGKTSVKEAIYAALSQCAKTHRSVKSFNNHWGVPLTMAVMPKASKYGVFETGMNHAGELSDLSGLLRPHISVITKIAAVHLEHFKDVSAIAEAKSEIFDGMESGGMAILPADDKFFEFLSLRALSKGLDVLSVGQAGSFASIKNVEALDIGQRVDLVVSGETLQVKLQNNGAHHALNAAFALAVSAVLGEDLKAAALGLERLAPLPGRGERFTVRLAGKSITIIDEAYNANPTSMRAAMAAASTQTGRMIAVLGDMGELGESEVERHTDLSQPLIEFGFDKVITVGPLMQNLYNVLSPQMRGASVAQASDVLEALENLIQDNDTILLKASNSMGLGTIISQLKEETA